MVSLIGMFLFHCARLCSLLVHCLKTLHPAQQEAPSISLLWWQVGFLQLRGPVQLAAALRPVHLARCPRVALVEQPTADLLRRPR